MPDRPIAKEETVAALLEREGKLGFKQVDEDTLDYGGEGGEEDGAGGAGAARFPEDTAAWAMAVLAADKKFAGYLCFMQNSVTLIVSIGPGVIASRRLASVQDANADRIVLRRAVPVSDCVAAVTAARRHFAAKAYAHGWFRLTDEDIAGYRIAEYRIAEYRIA